MARKKYNYNFVRKPSEGGKEALYMAGASVFLFLLAVLLLSFLLGDSRNAEL